MRGSVQPYAWMTYAEAQTRVSHIGAALKSLKVAPGDTVGIYATNSPEWMLAMKGCDYSGACCVPLYDTFGPDAVKFIIEHSDVKVVFCASDKFETLSKVLNKVSNQLSQVVVWSSSAGPSAEDVVTSVRLQPLCSSQPNSGVRIACWRGCPSCVAFGAPSHLELGAWSVRQCCLSLAAYEADMLQWRCRRVQSRAACRA